MNAIDDGPMLKVERARHHRDECDEIFEAWNDIHPVELVAEPERDLGVYEWSIRTGGDLPPEYGLAFGDMVHNLRSALDYVVHLFVAAAGEEPTYSNAFPLETAPERYRQKRANGPRDPLRFVDEAWTDEFLRWQPFNTHPGSPSDAPLAVLAKLDNTDKHRRLLGAPAGILGFEFHGHVGPFETAGVGSWQVMDRPARNGEVVLRFLLDPPARVHVDLNPQQFAVLPLIDVAPNPLPGFFEPVTEAIDAFRPFFD